MAKRNVVIGPRDLDVLSAVERSPLTVTQLLKLSHTFSQPFPDEHTLRRRLRLLKTKGLLRTFPYAIASGGRSPHYARLSRDGYRLLYGSDIALPRRRHFEAISDAHHYHTRALSEFIVQSHVAATQASVSFTDFQPENASKVEAGSFTLYPDCGFTLKHDDGRRFRFLVELDNGTERIRSRLDTESIERKIWGYDLHQSTIEAHGPERFVVLFVVTRSAERLNHILDLAAELVTNPQRRVFLGIRLADFLSTRQPLTESCFRDVHGRPCSLLPRVGEKAA